MNGRNRGSMGATEGQQDTTGTKGQAVLLTLSKVTHSDTGGAQSSAGARRSVPALLVHGARVNDRCKGMTGARNRCKPASSSAPALSLHSVWASVQATQQLTWGLQSGAAGPAG